ncbi:lytic murein transglycosylase [Comamonas composti]|uniref:lytic murein transglycosylase n=1 Tax=Comamonas composti TaxID=408558 RepID=UPI00047AABC7|nr:lytic murein transglycosylase [Comamonas composti]
MPSARRQLPLAALLTLGTLLAGCTAGPPEIEPAAQPAAPISPAAHAPQPEPPGAQAFEAWKREFGQQALAAGISADTVHQALEQARIEPQVLQLDKAQPEFTRTPWQYLDNAVSSRRLSQGRTKLAEAAAPLNAASQRYGVPATVIAAIWGMESNYGSNFGSFSTVNALATLAFDGRRAAWARKELLAALRILDSGDIDPAHMLGSWAGAMGHTQFLPSVFLAYAVDADGDGRRDIWGSMADVAASTAHYLQRSGWKSNEPWAQEVRLPRDFDYARSEGLRQHSRQWAELGVSAASGQPLADMEQANIFLPAGARGPALLVGANFRTILRYNNSTNYAMAVGLLAQQLGGGPALAADWPRELQPLSREQLRTMQAALNARGFEAGGVDGLLGPATRAALTRYQQSQGLVADGYPTTELLKRLQESEPSAAN